MKNKKQSEDFVRWLDTFMINNLGRINAVQSDYAWLSGKTSGGQNLNFSRLNSKAVEKFIKTSIDKYGVDHVCAPYYSHTKKVKV